MCIYKKSRDDLTRTGDHFVPNEVRYQLRYIPISVCKDTTIFHSDNIIIKNYENGIFLIKELKHFFNL